MEVNANMKPLLLTVITRGILNPAEKREFDLLVPKVSKVDFKGQCFGAEGARALAGAMGGMAGLTSLQLRGNGIGAEGARALAGALGGMVGLTSLELGVNSIGDEGARALAGLLGGMAGLTSLELGGNEIGDEGARALAGALGGMAGLTSLELQLSRKSGDDFLAWLEGNVKVEANLIRWWFAEPAQSARAGEILRRNAVVLKRAGQWMALNEEMVQPSAAKIVFCGNGEVGKTTLRESIERVSLRHEDVDEPSLKRTKGIEVRRLEVDGISLMLWDMAGQSEFHVFHSTFLAERNIANGKATICFLVVKSTFKEYEDAKKELQYWLRFIASAQPKVAEGSVGRERVEVVVVVNCWDGERKCAALYETWAQNLMEEERKKYAGRMCILTPTVLDVRGFRTREIDGLLIELSKRLKMRLKSYGACVPSTCALLALHTEELRLVCGDLPLMKWFTFREHLAKIEFGEMQEAPEGWETKLKYAVEYLHDVGQIVYFEKRELIILDPHWICYRMVGDLLLPDQLRGQFENLLKPRNGSVELKALQSWYEATLKLKCAGFSGEDVVDLLEWLSLCYRECKGGREEKVVIPALLTEDSLGDAEQRWMESRGGITVGRRIKCKEEELTLLSANFFQRLQADLALGEDGVSGIGRGWVLLTKPHQLVLLQYDVGRDCIDILVKQYKTDPQMDEEKMYDKAMGCLEVFANSVYEGCAKVRPGVSLVESVIIPWAPDALRSINEREIKGVLYLQDLLRKDGIEDARVNLSLGGVNDTVRVVYLLHPREMKQYVRPKGKEEADRRWCTGRWKQVVFISHAGEDKTFAHRLHDEFNKIGLSAFLDQATLLPKDQADPLMLKAVEEAPVGLALLSEHFPRKEWPMRELQIVVRQETLLPVLYNITYEGAKALLRTSPQAHGVTPDEWVAFTNRVLRTTALKDPVTSSNEGPLVQAIVFATVRVCVKVAHKVVEHSLDKLWAYQFVQQVEQAAKGLEEFSFLYKHQLEEAKTWANDMQYIAKSMLVGT